MKKQFFCLFGWLVGVFFLLLPLNLGGCEAGAEQPVCLPSNKMSKSEASPEDVELKDRDRETGPEPGPANTV